MAGGSCRDPLDVSGLAGFGTRFCVSHRLPNEAQAY